MFYRHKANIQSFISYCLNFLLLCSIQHFLLEESKLHILFLSGWYPSRVLPINGDFVQRHAEAIATKHKVSAVHLITDPKANESIEISISEINNVTTYIAYIKKTWNPIYKLYSFYKAYKEILKTVGDYHLIHLNKLYPFGIIAFLSKLFIKKPFLITEHWSGYQKPHNRKISFLEKSISKLIARKADFICPVSQHLAMAMENFGLKGQYHPVPNVVKTNIFIPKKETNKRLTLIHISSLFDEVKNVTGILNTLGALKKKEIDFICHFIGGTDTNFKEIISKNNLNKNDILFIDFLEQEKLVSYLQQADALLLFSNYENLPCVILEAFSTGIPVIATNVGGISEYFPENFGKLIKVQDEKDLEEAIISIQSTKWATPNEMHNYAVENFSPAMIADKFNYLYKKMLS
jgi:glycosyltransferase involved in cell wall biosynthesis